MLAVGTRHQKHLAVDRVVVRAPLAQVRQQGGQAGEVALIFDAANRHAQYDAGEDADVRPTVRAPRTGGLGRHMHEAGAVGELGGKAR